MLWVATKLSAAEELAFLPFPFDRSKGEGKGFCCGRECAAAQQKCQEQSLFPHIRRKPESHFLGAMNNAKQNSVNASKWAAKNSWEPKCL